LVEGLVQVNALGPVLVKGLAAPKVTGQVLTLDAALRDTIPALLGLLEALPEDSPFRQLDPPQRRQRTLDALKRVLLRESQAQQLLVCEDLRWIDTETQALLDTLVESLPSTQLVLLVNYRPEYQHGWGSKTYYTQIRIDPLSPASASVPCHGHDLLAAVGRSGVGKVGGLAMVKSVPWPGAIRLAAAGRSSADRGRGRPIRVMWS
jgi:hypothetical protein